MACIADLITWHNKLDHCCVTDISNMILHDIVLDLKNRKGGNNGLCTTCVEGKRIRTEIPRTTTDRLTTVLEAVHTDVWASVKAQSMSGEKYFVTFNDKESRWIDISSSRLRSDVLEYLMKYMTRAERQTRRKLNALHSDGGEEYVSKKFELFSKARGVTTELIFPYTPQQNGIAEPTNHTLLSMVRCMLQHNFGPKAVLGICYSHRGLYPKQSLD